MSTSTVRWFIGACCLAVASLAFVLGPSRDAGAHCDTMDGPVVAAARTALEKGDPAPVLKWVAKDREDEVKSAFARTRSARKASPEAREVADVWFFETLVRIHRAGEGEPYTGLSPSGTDPGPGVREAELALEKGDVDDLTQALAAAVTEGVKHRFARVLEAKKHSEQSVDAGREYVAAYVEFLHHVERLHAAAAGPAHRHGAEHEGR